MFQALKIAFGQCVGEVKRRPASRPAVRRRLLTLEVLEGRVLPAPLTLLWVGNANGNWNVAANWISSNAAVVTPQQGDTLIFGGTLGTRTGTNTSSNDNIAGLQIASLTVNTQYTQTITLSQPLSVGFGLKQAQSSGFMKTGNLIGSMTLVGGIYDWGGGNWGDANPANRNPLNVTVQKGATLVISNGAQNYAGRLTNNGTVNQTDRNNIILDGTFNNAGTWNANTTAGIIPAKGVAVVPSFNNWGTFNKNLAGRFTFGVEFDNRGQPATLNITNGILQFTNLATQSNPPIGGGGTTKIGNNATLQVTGSYQVDAGAMTTGTNSTIIGNLVMGGTLYIGGGGTVGLLTINGNYTQTASGVANFDIAGTSLDVLTVTNTVTLGGTLNVYTTKTPQNPVTIINGNRPGV